jgi:hypothetical protein
LVKLLDKADKQADRQTSLRTQLKLSVDRQTTLMERQTTLINQQLTINENIIKLLKKTERSK